MYMCGLCVRAWACAMSEDNLGCSSFPSNFFLRHGLSHSAAACVLA